MACTGKRHKIPWRRADTADEAAKARDDAKRAVVKDDPSRAKKAWYTFPQSPEELGKDVPVAATGLKGVSLHAKKFLARKAVNVSHWYKEGSRLLVSLRRVAPCAICALC